MAPIAEKEKILRYSSRPKFLCLSKAIFKNIFLPLFPISSLFLHLSFFPLIFPSSFFLNIRSVKYRTLVLAEMLLCTCGWLFRKIITAAQPNTVVLHTAANISYQTADYTKYSTILWYVKLN